MSRFVVRRPRPAEAEPAGSLVVPVAVGLALGATLGFLLGEWLGPVAGQVASRRSRPVGPPSLAELVHDAQAALAADVRLREWPLEVAPVGRGRIELRGWVDSRATRTRAARLVREAVNAEAVLNGILVHGEDDLPTDPGDEADDAVSA